MSTKWEKQADDATQAWSDAVLGADLPAEQRHRAAGEFQTIARRFAMGGEVALQVLAKRLSNESGERRVAAARLLASVPEARAGTVLLDVYAAHEPAPEPEPLAYLGSAAPLPSETWAYWTSARPAERAPLLRALLRHPTPAGRHLLEELLAGDDLESTRTALLAAEHWCEPDMLWRIARGGRRAPSEVPPFASVDLRYDAAFLLALRGEKQAVELLVAFADPARGVEGAHACVRLSWLGLPEAVPPVAKLLSDRDAFAVGLALDAAAALRAAALVEPLFALAARPDVPAAFDGSLLSEDALRIVAGIVGESLEPSGEALRDRARSLDPCLRYQAGEPLSLGHLVSELESPHTGPRRAAAGNLRAATGEDHGFRQDDDLIANLAAIERWRARAERPGPVAPGGWAWQGRSVPGPEVPE